MFKRLIINLFFRILRKDKEYRASWHDNIAMTIYDAGGDSTPDKHINANM